VRSVSVINFKGGVGKTTFTWLIGRYLATLGKKVIIVDIDPQMSLTSVLYNIPELKKPIDDWLKLENDQEVFSLSEILSITEIKKLPTKKNKVIISLSEKILFIPSTPTYYEHQFKIKNSNSPNVTGFISKLFHEIGKKNPDIEYVFFDCPPSFTPLMSSALHYSDIYLIPANSDKFGYYTLKALGNFILLLDLHKRLPKPPIGCVFLNRIHKYGGRTTNEDINECNWIIKEASDRGFIMANTRIYEKALISKSLEQFELNNEIMETIRPLWDEIEQKCW
jgi:chromosome partitioning protein